jgi:hypothetical protein
LSIEGGGTETLAGGAVVVVERPGTSFDFWPSFEVEGWPKPNVEGPAGVSFFSDEVSFDPPNKAKEAGDAVPAPPKPKSPLDVAAGAESFAAAESFAPRLKNDFGAGLVPVVEFEEACSSDFLPNMFPTPKIPPVGADVFSAGFGAAPNRPSPGVEARAVELLGGLAKKLDDAGLGAVVLP